MSISPSAENLEALLAHCATEAPASWCDQRQELHLDEVRSLRDALRRNVGQMPPDLADALAGMATKFIDRNQRTSAWVKAPRWGLDALGER